MLWVKDAKEIALEEGEVNSEAPCICNLKGTSWLVFTEWRQARDRVAQYNTR
jgi:hypothetical protein